MLPAVLRWRWVTPWQSYQFITGTSQPHHTEGQLGVATYPSVVGGTVVGGQRVQREPIPTQEQHFQISVFPSCFFDEQQSSIHFLWPLLLQSGPQVVLEPIPAVFRQRLADTLDKSPVYCCVTQKDKQPFTLTYTPMADLAFLIRLMCTPLDSVRKAKNTLWYRATMLHTERPQAWGSNLLPSCCEATVMTSAPPCRPCHSHCNNFAHLSENICHGECLPTFNLPDNNLALWHFCWPNGSLPAPEQAPCGHHE